MAYCAKYKPEELTREAKVNRVRKLLYKAPEFIKQRFQWDDEAMWSLTHQRIADIICLKLLELNDITCNSTFTDATASVGGNTISFAKYFKQVNAVELNPVRKSMLEYNVKLYRFHNVNTYMGDCIKLIPNMKQDVIFFDPPWGTDYKKFQKNTMRINFANTTIENIICNFHQNAKYCVVKLPRNYDFTYFESLVLDVGEIICTLNFNKPNSFTIKVIKYHVSNVTVVD
ncbi:Putative RNA cap guanine-N2 methyltransferase [Pacmanvirus A23]|uniref:Putative RNA cap guanine-N2 methyltransferase n=1 Tax=Pacmanvirus A23 TaxID=1932881 RepID=UPI000A095DBD|nr:Putative RNA cap guanine-N2 methyltransferase [Pacmanvirus A23]SIP86092.1 Putative RNA cap guanine-N2 methyltransferase [Pacmanvirus A23]